ncbi:MAG: tRNA uridine-5-carboxymethylaminomethyl(34) synthesis enzyme MnmG [Eubacteriales bacterium]|nr:tRNA uridine-5-carboxymethylaminomethyl(34) synthesis enzyme MnmG [Eubacteriales bacterium]
MKILAEENVDVVVIGAGHAGCEAALASARIGFSTVLFSINLDSIAMMPCNPNIGGSSKGHLVKEIDALGGEMGKIIDKSYIQTRMLNTSKGPAVYSLRAQADKNKYHREMKKVLENTDNLEIVQGEITEIFVEDGKVTGALKEDGIFYKCGAVIICSGTYLKSKCLYGDMVIESGPNGLRQAIHLSDCLKNLGIKMYRFKTGTPARIDKRSVDFSKMTVQNGDEKIVPFSFENTPEDIKREQLPCYLTYTNENTHKIINENLHRSAMYGGMIEGTGPRYCPSIEDKIVRFADKDRHQVFIEPEGEDTNEMYVQGMSTSLPFDVQLKMYRSVEGLENCKIMRNAYAIEYDCIDATQLKLSLEFKNISGLFSAGQFNGTSGYEEAAAQGIIAGINATKYLKGEEPLILDRSEAYIGVLIDDIVTKGSLEPYRMMTSRAEYRLLLRQDNADLRLTEKGYEVGLIKEDRYQRFLDKKLKIEQELKRVKKISIAPTEEVNNLISEKNSTPLTTGIKFTDLIKRTELSYEFLKPIDKDRPELSYDIEEQINIQIKYEGYIERQLRQVEQFKKLEKKFLPKDINYDDVPSISLEGRQKLKEIRPISIGHASRISGISPADINMLLVYLNL